MLWITIFLVALTVVSQLHAVKYRICVVDAERKSREALKYCPMLKGNESKAECVFGNSRLDCLRMVADDEADFGVFNAEDLVVALNYKTNDFSVTHEIQFFEKEKYEYEVMTVVRKSSNITRLSQLRGKNFCHPGFGDDSNWTEIILKFFEARVVPQQCDPSLSLEENAINSSSSFFNAACKAGPWVLDPKYDEELKAKYPNLCKLCDSPQSCSTMDKYWGRVGSLYCLTDGLGDVAWGRLDDINQHFGITPGGPSNVSPDDYNFLCDDGSLAPLDKPQDCTWVAHPWQSILARRKSAEGVQKVVSLLKGTSTTSSTASAWKTGLQLILHPSSHYVLPLDTVVVPEDYLSKAPGFRSANSMHRCGNVLRMCTHTSAEHTKCNWLKRAAQVYGVEPVLSCILLHSMENCLMAVHNNLADVVVVTPEWMTIAQRKYDLKSLLYEFSRTPANMVNVAAVVKSDSPIKSLTDLRGKKACFSQFEGIGWNSVVAVFQSKSLLPAVCPYEAAIGQFFSEACVPGLNESVSSLKNMLSLCEGNTHFDEADAFKCIAIGKGDVAFVTWKTVISNTDGANNESWAATLKFGDFRSLCMDSNSDDKYCYLSWASPGQVMVHSSLTEVRAGEVYTAFKKMSVLFGPSYKGSRVSFNMFGPFNGQKNVLFNDFTEQFEDFESLSYAGRRPRNLQHMMASLKKCSVVSSGIAWTAKWLSIVAVIFHSVLI
ncbi:transferrin isoform X2 [Anabrus simplex]|uniref:transferrin isoform X2 n=1 Tax=Anabrus simplex TaxID=316456 RepID=UPI0035A38A0B